MKDLDIYEQIDEDIATTALNAIKRHLWYLGDELILLSFFSEKASCDEKDDMVLLLIKKANIRTQNSFKYTDEIQDIQGLQLNDFVSTRSFFLFEILEIDAEFLRHSADTRHANILYKKAKRMIRDLIVVVNDGAERVLQLGAKIISNQKVRSE